MEWRRFFGGATGTFIFFRTAVFSQRNKQEETLAPPETSLRQEQRSEQGQDAVKPSQGVSDKKGVGPNGKIRLFGTLELLTKTGEMPKWDAVLDKERKHPGFVDDRTFRSAETWKTIKARLEGLSTPEQIREVNKLLNRWPYRTDMEVWGLEDYWAAPVDFFKKSGDCEDFAIAKYFALRNLGFPQSALRIVVIQDTLRNVAHAVCVVYADGDAWVLDSLSNVVLPHTRLMHYQPRFSLNEAHRWAHIVPGRTATRERERQ